MRPKTISDEVLLGLFEAYFVEECGENKAHVNVSGFGAYIRNKGYNVQDHTIRRCKPVAERIRAFKDKNSPNNITATEVAFIPLDIESFLEKNNTAAKIKTALSNRDQYYSSVSDRCINALKQNHELVKKVDSLTLEMKEQQKNTEAMAAKLNEKISEVTKLRARLKSLTDYIKDNVYPAIANELLIEDGDAIAVGDKESVLKESAIKKSLFTGTEKEAQFGSNNIIQGLFDDFYSDEDK